MPKIRHTKGQKANSSERTRQKTKYTKRSPNKKKEDINTRRKIAGMLDVEVQRQTFTTEGKAIYTQETK